MVKQGDIIKINLNPKQGHEQQGFRPYICLSNKLVNEYSNLGVFAPISNTKRSYPFYISLDGEELKTTGKILLDQLVAIDFESRGYHLVESCSKQLTQDLLKKVKTIFQED